MGKKLKTNYIIEITNWDTEICLSLPHRFNWGEEICPECLTAAVMWSSEYSSHVMRVMWWLAQPPVGVSLPSHNGAYPSNCGTQSSPQPMSCFCWGFVTSARKQASINTFTYLHFCMTNAQVCKHGGFIDMAAEISLLHLQLGKLHCKEYECLITHTTENQRDFL